MRKVKPTAPRAAPGTRERVGAGEGVRVRKLAKKRPVLATSMATSTPMRSAQGSPCPVATPATAALARKEMPMMERPRRLRPIRGSHAGRSPPGTFQARAMACCAVWVTPWAP